MKTTLDYYNKTATEWEKRGYQKDGELPCLSEFVQSFPKGSRFLDLCCGCGYESQRIRELGYAVVGIDFSEECLEIARRHNPDIPFYQDNLLNDYSYIGKVDAVILIAGLVHIENAQLETAFFNMEHVLNENGMLFISVCGGEGKVSEWSLTTIDGEEYDRNFIAHTLDELIAASAQSFSFVTEVGADDSSWHNYIFQKKKDIKNVRKSDIFC